MNTTKTYPSVAQSWGITGIVIACMILFTPVNAILNNVVGKEYSMLIYYVLTMGAAFIMSHFIRKNEIKITTYSYRIKKPQLIPLIIIAALGLLFGVVTPIGNLIPMPDIIKEMFRDLATMNGFGAFLMMVVAAPVFEELIFRGIILDGLLKRYTARKAILLSAFLFAFVHLNPWQFVTGMVIGAFIGWIYYHTRSLSISIIIHAAVNSIGFFMRFFIDEEAMLDQSLTEAYGGMTNTIVITSAALLVALISIYWLRTIFSKKTEIENV